MSTVYVFTDFGGPETQQLLDRPAPQPGPGEVAGLVTDPARIISAADATTATELGGAALERTEEAMEKITEVIEYGLVDPHVTACYPLAEAGRAIAEVEAGHATGKIVIEPTPVC